MNFDALTPEQMVTLHRLLGLVTETGSFQRTLTLSQMKEYVFEAWANEIGLNVQKKVLIYLDNNKIEGKDKDGVYWNLQNMEAKLPCAKCSALISTGWFCLEEPFWFLCPGHMELVTRTKKATLRGR